MILKNLDSLNLDSFPIVIFGSGPAGMSTALELEKKGYSWIRNENAKVTQS